MTTLVTGGAGFIGSHLVHRLLREGGDVTVLDNFSEQVHGGCTTLAKDVAPHVRLVRGDVRDRRVWSDSLKNADTVIHLAAETGTGQSMYEISTYAEVNMGGTANLLQGIVNDPRSAVERVVIASSRAVYGEGAYRCGSHAIVYPEGREREDLANGIFNPRCPECGEVCAVGRTREDAALRPSSFYGLTKKAQEEMPMMFAKNLGLSCYALRFQNVYGPGQSLNNPYTGILAIFSTLARLNRRIEIFEDGQESRDFIYVDDVVEAIWRAVSVRHPGIDILNVGSGVATTVLCVAQEIVKYFRSKAEIAVTGAYRAGDIRHNIADTAKAADVLGFSVECTFKNGLRRFLEWAASEPVRSSKYEESLAEMKGRGLLHA